MIHLRISFIYPGKNKILISRRMSANLKHQLQLLKLLITAKPAIRREILKQADEKLSYAICEICHNFLRGNVPCSKHKLKKLKKYKNKIRKLATIKKHKTLKKYKKLLQQKGTGIFLPLILEPAVTGLISYLVSKTLK